MKRRNRSFLIILTLLLFLIGLAIMLYPHFQGASVDAALKQDVQSFYTWLEEVPPSTEGTEPVEVIEPEPVPHHTELLSAMQAYNNTLWEEKQAGLKDSWSYTQPSFFLAEYGLDSEIFGILSIPKLNIEMPLYLGATEQHLALGAAHLSQTSLPIGGNNTNCVIAGHRGYGGATYFRYITDLQPGDIVSVTNLWETLTYTVCEIKIIQPYEVKEICIREGRDLLTLLTCHPYASGGKYRYLVICQRTQ